MTRKPPAQGGAAPQDLTVPDALAYAVRLHKEGHVEGAREVYSRILALVPDHVDALHFLGVASHQLGDSDRAAELIRHAVALRPDHADAHNNLGNVLAHLGRVKKAAKAYRRVIELEPAHADAHNNLGAMQKKLGDLDQAVDAYRRAIALDPDHADAYHNLGIALREQDHLEEAILAFRRAITLRPYHADSYKRVGAALNALGRMDEAAATYRKWLEIEPQNPIAQHLLAASTEGQVPARAADDFVKATFDTFADSFDKVLDRLQYRAPALVASAIADALGPPGGGLEVLDAGCGTGLCGAALRPYARRLVGVDLSPGMLDKAAARATYDELVAAELTLHLRERCGAYDLVASADTLVYFGELGPALAAAAEALRPGGHLVFTLERAPEETAPGGYRLQPHGRYSHTEPYLRGALDAAALVVTGMARAHLRLEGGTPVEGFLVSARKDGPAPSGASVQPEAQSCTLPEGSANPKNVPT